MTVRERVARGKVSSKHIVQFFDTDESRAACVAEFLAEGYWNGEPLVVVARPANWAAIAEQLEKLQIPVQNLLAHRRLVVKDAAETLRRISRNGSPDAAAFEAVVGKIVDALDAAGPCIRAYGEMVDMLAQRSELPDAIKLEALWNTLSERSSLFLMCGSSAAHFVSTGTHRAMREICSMHTDVHRHAQDPLASWLLTTAHNSLASSGRSSSILN